MTPFNDTFPNDARLIVELNIENEKFNASSLAEALNLSRSQTYRKLKATTNLSTSEFINGVRLRKAVELLKETNLSVKEISYRVGFSDPTYFTRMFSKIHGQSPAKYRNLKTVIN